MEHPENRKKTGTASGAGALIGLTILLRKFGVKKLPADDETEGLLVLGHYDRMLLKPITRWLDFTSNSAADDAQAAREPERPDVNTMVTYYPIKVLFPDAASLPDGAGDTYGAWKDFRRLLHQEPCVTLVLLNLTDRYNEHTLRETRLRALLDLFASDAEMTRLSEAVKLCLLPCIGYSDFCILMSGGSWKPAMEVVERLHAMVDAHGEPILSTDYMIPAFHGFVSELKPEHFEGLTLTARINLHPGATAKRLQNDLGNHFTVYRTSGGTDCLLKTQTPEAACDLFRRLLTLETETSPLIDVASTLHLEESAPAEMQSVEKRDPAEEQRTEESAPAAEQQAVVRNPETGISFSDCIKKLYDTISSYEVALIKHRRHRRQATALREMAAIVLNVCSQLHAASLREIMVSFIQDLDWCLQRCITEMEAQEERWGFEEMELNVAEFCASVTEFITDLSRSDCFYMEREKYTHPAVSSATGLLMAYNRWLNGFTRAVMQATDTENRSEYTFLVTSGGRNDTSAFDAFNFLSPERDGQSGPLERFPILPRLSEMSLYDFSGTILRCFHECLHFCGARYRRDRLEYMKKFATRTFAHKLAENLFPASNLFYFLDVYHIAWPNGAKADTIQKESMRIYQRCFEKVRDETVEALLIYLSRQEPKSEEELYAVRVERWMYDCFMEAFSGGVRDLLYSEKSGGLDDIGDLNERLFDAVQQAYLEYYRDANRLVGELEAEQRKARRSAEALDEPERTERLNALAQVEGRTAIFGFELAKQKALIRHREAPYLRKSIDLAISRLLTADPPLSYTEDEERWEKFPFADLTFSNIEYVLSMMRDVFTETFSDLISCRILGVKIEDYLLAQVYEDWNPDDSLPQDDPSRFRISAVLYLLFQKDLTMDELRLCPAAKAAIKDAVAQLEAHGMRRDRIDPQALCTRVNALLSDFEQRLWIGEPLLDYLKLCLDNYEKAGAWEALASYRNDFQRIRLLSIEPDAEDTHSRIIAMYRALITGGEKQNEP